ncbi:hypothetical protein [Qipengyuania vesicularis]|uniref:hypothetical protein n=1 Tax=Qipengyuania vesicularis TaxID=2867232 RepID=UPI001C8693D4|nr:hypothetical protein [Qipengyuania vesicularis]MBX7527009.1 hypothetical protein [Qipengyuania vesicularis]
MADDSLKISSAAQATFVTVQSESLCHYITDDELDKVSQMSREPVSEICIVSIGAFIGSLFPALDAVSQLRLEAAKADFTDIVTFLIAVASFGIACVTGFLWSRRAESSTALVKKIRSRPRVRVEAG